VVEGAKGILTEADELSDEDESLAWVNTRSVGRTLTKLRIQEERGEPPKRERYRRIVPKDIAQLAIAHHLVHLAEETSITSNVVQTSTEGWER
jgi:hypothetical protein